MAKLLVVALPFDKLEAILAKAAGGRDGLTEDDLPFVLDDICKASGVPTPPRVRKAIEEFNQDIEGEV